MFAFFQANAQQLGNYNIYHMNKYLHNPASVGTLPYVFLSTSYSQAWTGFSGAPNMYSVSAHSLISPTVAFGGKMNYENTGLTSRFGAEASYAYHIPISDNGTKLSLGISALLEQHSLLKDKFLMAHPDDEAVVNSENSVIIPDAAFGLSFYKENSFFVNYSIYQLFDRKVNYLNDDNIENKRVRHHYFNLGYRFHLSENFKLEPSALIKLTEKGMLQFDAGIKGEIKDVVYLGCYYKSNEAIAPFIGINTHHVAVGYSYGMLLGDISNYSLGSHEIMLIIKINNYKKAL